jgi:hypothetical protein
MPVGTFWRYASRQQRLGEEMPTRGQPELPAVIRAICPNCDEVDVAVGAARLEIANWVDEATCRFACPRCNVAVAKPVPPPLVQVLIRMGVRYDHPGQTPPSPPPPLTTADLERFLQELATFEG